MLMLASSTNSGKKKGNELAVCVAYLSVP